VYKLLVVIVGKGDTGQTAAMTAQSMWFDDIPEANAAAAKLVAASTANLTYIVTKLYGVPTS